MDLVTKHNPGSLAKRLNFYRFTSKPDGHLPPNSWDEGEACLKTQIIKLLFASETYHSPIVDDLKGGTYVSVECGARGEEKTWSIELLTHPSLCKEME